MKTIHKFPIDIYGSIPVKIMMPKGAKVQYVDDQRISSIEEIIAVWAEVDTDATMVARTFDIFGTGHSIPDSGIYLGTVKQANLVLHVYEIVAPKAAK